jgi:hypothetical protein
MRKMKKAEQAIRMRHRRIRLLVMIEAKRL